MINLFDLESNYNIRIANSCLAKNKSEAIYKARNFNFPLVIKIESPDILHKTDIGGVALNINNINELGNAYDLVLGSVKKKKPEAKIKGVIIQEMLPEGFELIIGYNKDPVFGPVIMLGMGGIFTEVFKDVVFRLLPITKRDAYKMLDDLRFYQLLFKGFRNIEKVSRDMLAELIMKVSNLAMELDVNITSFDLNPVIVWGKDYRVVDFKVVSGNEKGKIEKQNFNINNLEKFFNASSIALIGASDSKGKISGIVLDSLLRSGYKGKIHPINPKYGNVMGLKAYKTLLDIPDNIELVVITISLTRIPDILEQCRKKNISNVIIISAGGKEIGNHKTENRIKEIALNNSIRIIGCNCLGVFDSISRIDTLFQPYEHLERPGNGSISLISQSGTVGIASLELLGSFGINKFISYGNRIDVDEGDLIEFLAKDSSTEVIAVYIEGLERGRKFFKAVKKASKEKPVIIYKAGRTPQASKAVLSHTGALAGTHNLIKGVLDQAGALQVDSIEGLLASAKTLSVYPRISKNRSIIITNGAGTVIQSIDKIIEQGKLRLAELSKESISSLRLIFPEHVIIGNPIDLTGTATDEQYETALRVAVEDKNVDIIMAWFVFQCKPITEKISLILKKYSRIKPIICGAMGTGYTYRISKLIEKEKVPIFFSVDDWVTAAGSLFK